MNGYHALKGFEYQTTVSLYLMLEYFHNKKDDILIRPEGKDDLVVTFGNRNDYIQIKKPRENAAGELTNKIWSISEIARDILISSYSRIADTQDRQIIVLGDKVDSEITLIMNNNGNFTSKGMLPYLQIVHLIAREKAQIPVEYKLKFSCKAGARYSSLEEALFLMFKSFEEFAQNKGIPAKVCCLYRSSIVEINKKLPSVLDRTEILCTFGSEKDIRERIKNHLTRHYNLQEEIVKNSLIKNLRGFLNDIATQPDKWISREQFESEIRNIWPRMTFIGEPPTIDPNHVHRPTLVKRLIDSATLGPTEVIGVSGSGKTLIAREIVDYIKFANNDVETLYVEVNNTADFRDVLAGIAFSLRNFEITKPFSIVIQPNYSNEKVYREIAQELNAIEKPMFILLDFVEGTCNDNFAKNIINFLESYQSKYVHIMVFGQESIFRGLSGLQRECFKIPAPIYMPGLDFEEFVELVAFYHGKNFDRTDLWHFFEQLTAGRSAGLFARLANNFASGAIDDMVRWVTKSPDQIMEEADRIRYQRIPESLRSTADKIICFVLPFTIEEAKNIFHCDYVVEAIREMLRHGLLRYHDENLLEMHETIRLGLEEFTPPKMRQKTHDTLANYYFTKGDIIAAILHFERAGKKIQAGQIARERFLSGEDWGALSAYVADNKLVGEIDLINFISANPLHSNAYILPSLFKRLGTEDTAQNLLNVITKQFERFIKDFNWAWLVTEAILTSDATKIYRLLEFGIQKAEQKQSEVLQNIVFGSRRNRITVDESLLKMFVDQTKEIKMQLIPILLRDKRREVLRPALEFLSNYSLPKGVDVKRIWEVNQVLGELKLVNEQEVIEFILAIPQIVDIKDITLSKSVLLGNLSNYIWEQRHVIRTVCKKLLADKTENETALENAMRILFLLGDTDLIKLSESFIGKEGRLGSVALFILTLNPKLLDLDFYKQRLFDTELNFNERFVAFYILLSVNAGVDDWFKRLLIIDRANSEKWEYMLLINCVRHPSKSVIPILKGMLEADKGVNSLEIYASCILKISELYGEEITDFLITLLSNPSSMIRATACMSLQFRRNSRAFPALVGLCRQEENEGVGQMAIVAAIASGPTGFIEFAKIWERFPQAAIWRCILAGRLQVMSEAPFLIKKAIDREEHWQIRRAAILAAGRLCSRTVMVEIAESVFAEEITFVLDNNHSLLGHNILSRVSLDFARDLKSRYFVKKEWCHNLVADIFDAMKEQAIFSNDTPNGTEAAKWLFEKLESNKWPEDLSGADNVSNKLHIPILYAAVLRGLRLCGCLDMIEEIISTTDTEWVLIRALCEWLKGRIISKDELLRIERIVESTSFGKSPYVKNVLKNIESRTLQKKVVPYIEDEKPKCRQIIYDDIKRALKDGDLQTDLPLVIKGLDKDQFLQLVQELSPENDYNKSWLPSKPHLYFTESGYSVKGVKPQSIEKYKKIRTTLRSALVAANRFNVQIFWHDNLLKESKYGRDDYIRDLLVTFAVQEDSEKFYEELEVYGDIYLTELLDFNTYKLVERLFDQRIIPFLQKWLYSGKDELLEVLSRIASSINDCSIDGVLADLFYRWCKLLKLRYSGPPTDNIHLWRAFKCLKEHSRFTTISDYDLRLAELLEINIPWYNKNDIVEVLAKSPRMYCKLETLLMKAAPFEHFLMDEVDRLDDAGQHLFSLSK